jgi:hypothetical protein
MPEKTACNVVPCSIQHDSFVFVSYAHQDSDKVFPVIELISAGGYALWYDKGINISSVWTDEIALAILNSKIFLIFVSKNAVTSPYVRSEIEFALNNNKKIIPVYLDGMDILPPGLALGLSATQGVLDTRNSRDIANQVCGALEYNQIMKRDGVGAGSHARKEKPRLIPICVGAGAGALATAMAFYVLSLFPGEAPEPAIAKEEKTFSTPGEPRPPGASSDPSAKKLSLIKSTFAPGEFIHIVDLPGLTEEMTRKGSIIGVAAVAAPHGDYLTHEFIAPHGPVVRLQAPLQSGDYEVRWYDNGSVLTPSSLAGLARFNVKENAKGAFSFSIDKTTYAPGERVSVKVSGVPSHMLARDGALVGLFPENPAPGEFLTYMPIRSRDDQFFLDVPSTPGKYEIRGHVSNILDEPTLVARILIVVERQERGS